MSVLFAATYPERTAALVLYGAFAATAGRRLPMGSATRGPSPSATSDARARARRLGTDGRGIARAPDLERATSEPGGRATLLR